MAIIDWNKFNENFKYYDKSVILEVIDIFVDEHDKRISDLQKNIEEKDFSNLAFNAHSLKSVIANYMAPKALGLTRKLEESAKSNSEEEVHEIFTELKIATKELLLELEDYRQNA